MTRGTRTLIDSYKKETPPPEVSVIVPVYNGEERLVPCIRSLLDQQNVALEIVLINDASTDGTRRLIDALAQDHAAIVPVHLPRNGGVHEARITGLKYARAPWIGFMDADDFVRPYMFSTLLHTGQREDVDIVVCGSDRVDASRNVIANKLRFRCAQRVDSNIPARFCKLEFGTGSLWNKLYRRDIIMPCRDLQFPWRQNINEDMILNLDCFRRARAVFLLPEILYEYVFNPHSVTSRMDKGRAYAETFRACALALNVLPNLDSYLRMLIVDLYRRQLGFNDYCLASSEDLAPHEADLAEAVSLIYRVDPTALAMLALRTPRVKKSRKAMQRLWWLRPSFWLWRLR
jgi:glycosyltransferase involved in cell wall biosynthesis